MSPIITMLRVLIGVVGGGAVVMICVWFVKLEREVLAGVDALAALAAVAALNELAAAAGRSQLEPEEPTATRRRRHDRSSRWSCGVRFAVYLDNLLVRYGLDLLRSGVVCMCAGVRFRCKLASSARSATSSLFFF